MGHRDDALTPAVERALDGMLASWTQKQRLSEANAETIRQRLIQTAQSTQSTETDLNYAWWRRLFKQCTATPQPSMHFWSHLCGATAPAGGNA